MVRRQNCKSLGKAVNHLRLRNELGRFRRHWGKCFNLRLSKHCFCTKKKIASSQFWWIKSFRIETFDKQRLLNSTEKPFGYKPKGLAIKEKIELWSSCCFEPFGKQCFSQTLHGNDVRIWFLDTVGIPNLGTCNLQEKCRFCEIFEGVPGHLLRCYAFERSRRSTAIKTKCEFIVNWNQWTVNVLYPDTLSSSTGMPSRLQNAANELQNKKFKPS